MSKGTENLAQVLLQAIKAELLDVHTCLPARIERYDETEQKADIAPLLKKKYKFEDNAVDLPIVTNVPVQWPSANAGAAFIHLPLKVGDYGIVVFSERSIDSWLAGEGDSVSPEDPRHHHLSDAVFIPGVLPFKKALSVSSGSSLFVKNGDAEIELTESGDINILGGNINFGTGIEKAVLGDTLAALYAAHTHTDPVSGSTGPPSNVLTTALSGKVNLE